MKIVQLFDAAWQCCQCRPCQSARLKKYFVGLRGVPQPMQALSMWVCVPSSVANKTGIWHTTWRFKRTAKCKLDACLQESTGIRISVLVRQDSIHAKVCKSSIVVGMIQIEHACFSSLSFFIYIYVHIISKLLSLENNQPAYGSDSSCGSCASHHFSSPCRLPNADTIFE